MTIDLLLDQVTTYFKKKQVIGDVFFTQGTGLEVSVRHGQLEGLKQSNDCGYGIRIMNGKKVGFSYHSSLIPSDIIQALDQAYAVSELIPEDIDAILQNAPTQFMGNLDIFDEMIEKRSLDEKIECVKTIESIAFAKDSRITKTEDATYSDAVMDLYYYNSFLSQPLHYRSSFNGVMLSIIAEANASAEVGSGYFYSTHLNDLDIQKVACDAAFQACSMLGATSQKSGNYAAIFDQETAIDLLSLLASMLSAEEVYKRKSPLAGQVGKQVMASCLGLVDDATLLKALNAYPFDGEGTQGQRKILVVNGVLQTFLTDCKNAQRINSVPTGNASRGSFDSLPLIKPSNLYIQAGTKSDNDLLGILDRGLLITSIMGLHMANPITGDFSVGVSGYWIEKGKIARPIKGLAMAGNLLQLLHVVKEVGNDILFRPSYGNLGSPRLLVESVAVSGD